MKIRHLILFNAILISLCTLVQAAGDTKKSADQLYQQQKWSEAIIKYIQVLKIEPENEQVWYRMAQSHLNLKQGKLALAANIKLSNASQIPMSAVLYQNAQAHALTDDRNKMWQSLDRAVEAGFVNINDLINNPIWQEHKQSERFAGLRLQVDKNVRPCMHHEQYRAFDFWLGHWEVYGNADKSGPLYGHNSITQVEQGCLVMEHWQGASGSSGTSMNYYDGAIGKWVQHWVSNGTVIDYSGGLEVINNKMAMQLKGYIHYASPQQKPQTRDFRGTWTPLDGGVVQQLFEESVDGGETWTVWFNGFYFPTSESIK